MFFFLGTILSLLSFNALAQNIHYFGSIKAAQTNVEDNEISFDGIKNKITVSPLTTAGFSFDANLNDKYQTLAQFIYANQSITVDLLQLRYHMQSDFVLRVGKQRLPFHLHSENIQVQALLPWIAAPREVYGRVPIYTFTGISVEKNVGDNFGLHLYAGDMTDKFVDPDVEYITSASNLIGARANLKFNNLNAFVNAFRAEGTLRVKSDLDATIIGSPVPGTTIGFKQDYTLQAINGFSGGLQYHPKNFFVISEYTVLSTKNPFLERVEGAYVSLGKEINEKWVPVATFSTDLDVASQLSPTKTSTYAFNLNYRLDFNNILKIGYEHVNYKERTVVIGPGQSSSANLFTNGSPGENFDVYSFMWAFVY